MDHPAGRAVAIVVGACLAAVALTSQTMNPLPVDASQGEAAVWQKEWHPAFTPRMSASVGLHNVQRVGDRFAITGGDDHGAVVWWSDDGVEWARSPSSAATKHGVGASVAGGPGGYVMVGRQWSPSVRARIWHSPDGIEWERAAAKLPRSSDAWSVATLADGTFVIYGGEGRGNGCWMGSSVDEGVTWDFRWNGGTDFGYGRACVSSAQPEGGGLVAKIMDGISQSADGITWQEIVSADDIRAATPRGKERRRDVGLVPLGDGRFVLGGRGTRTLTWSREHGLEVAEDLIDWSGLPRVTMAIGPERTVAVRDYMPVPLLSPPADEYAEPRPKREPVCRPYRPTIANVAAMRPRERLECYGGRKLTFKAWIPFMEYGGVCFFGAPHSWMECEDYYLASGPGSSPGFLRYALAPDARLDKGLQPGSSGTHVRVTGHFDDPAARQCPEPGWNGKVPQGWDRMTRSDFVNECRRQFVVTEMQRLKDGTE